MDSMIFVLIIVSIVFSSITLWVLVDAHVDKKKAQIRKETRVLVEREKARQRKDYCDKFKK